MERVQQLLATAGHSITIDGIVGPQTRKIATAYLKDQFRFNSFLFTDDNIVAKRMSDDYTDKFSDFAFVINKGKVVSIIPWTTKPGKYWVHNPVTVGGITGTGCMVEGQWMESHRYEKTAKRRWGKAGYFLQLNPIKIYRDGNKDNILDKNVITKAPSWYGFFLHAMGRGFSIWNWSAGCNGCSKALWQQNIDPYFEDGDIINYTIL